MIIFCDHEFSNSNNKPFSRLPGGCKSKVVGFEQGGDEKLGDVSVVAQGGVKELAPGGSWTLVKSPRKVKEDRKRERDYDEEFPVLVNTRSTKNRVEKVGEVKKDKKSKRDNLFREERMSKRKIKFEKDKKKVVNVVIKSKPDVCLSDKECPVLVNTSSTKARGVVQKERECVIKKVEIDAFGENINHEEETQSNDSDEFIYEDGVSDFDESDKKYEGVISPDKLNLEFVSKSIEITPLVESQENLEFGFKSIEITPIIESQENVNESAKVVASERGLCDAFMRNGENATFKGTSIQMKKDLTEREKRFLKTNKQDMKSNSNVNPEVKGDVIPEIVPPISPDSLNVSSTRKRRRNSSIVLTPPSSFLHDDETFTIIKDVGINIPGTIAHEVDESESSNTCYMCLKELSSADDVLRHLKKRHDIEVMSVAFDYNTSVLNFETGKNMPNLDEKLACTVCPSEFSSVSCLESHIQSDHGGVRVFKHFLDGESYNEVLECDEYVSLNPQYSQDKSLKSS